MDALYGVLNNLHFQTTTFVCQAVMFLCLHFFLQTILYGPLIRARNQRDGQINGRLAQAESLAANARRLKTEYEEQIRSMRQGLQSEVQDATAQAEKAASAKLSKAREQASELLEAARKQVEKERQEAAAGLGAQARKLGEKIARRVIETSMSDKARDKALSRIGGA